MSVLDTSLTLDGLTLDPAEHVYLCPAEPSAQSGRCWGDVHGSWELGA